MRKLHVVLFVATLVIQQAHTQDSLRSKPVYLHSGKIGVGIDGITGSPNMLLKYFFNNQLAMEMIVGLEVYVPGGSPPTGSTKVTGITLRGGLGVLFHLTQDPVSFYVGAEGIFESAKSGGFYVTVPDPKNSVIGSGIFGAEYFFNERFTIGIKQALGVTVSFKRNQPKESTDINLNTSTLVTGRFYFN
jgi:hypothetical protein